VTGPPFSAEVVGLNEFRAALRRAEVATPRQLTKALKEAGVPLVEQMAVIAAHRTGRLAESYRTRVIGTTGNIVSRVPYGAKAEWSRKRGWTRYGPPGRFAARVVEEQAEATLVRVAAGLRDVIDLYGWAHGA
jgi:hypothetical protein